MQLSAGAMTAGLATTNIAHAESAAQKARAVDHLRQARSLASFSGGELGAVQAASFFLYTTVYKNSLLSSRKKAMRICLANRRKGNSKGKLYLGSNQFLGCGIAANKAAARKLRCSHRNIRPADEHRARMPKVVPAEPSEFGAQLAARRMPH